MRIFWLEIKRVLKSRRTMVLLMVALLMSALMGYFPASFEYVTYEEENGNIIELEGVEAIAYKKDRRAANNGEITREKIKGALETYQSLVNQYGDVDSESFPLDIYSEKIFPIRPLLHGLSEAFGDPETGVGADLMDIEPNEIDHFYEKCMERLNVIMVMEQKDYATAQSKAKEKYSNVTTPFKLYGGYSRDAFDYIELYILLVAIICIAISAPIFSNEYQTGSDSILRCTKYGRAPLAIAKVMASFTIFTVAYLLCITVHLLVSNLLFGFECMETSFHMLYSIVSLPNFNLGHAQVVLALGGLLSLLATVSFTLFLSAKCKDALSALLISIVACLLPTFLYSALGGNWISCILPSGGVGMHNNLLYQLIDFNYLHIGQMSFWTPYVILGAAVIEIPLFVFLTVRAYCKHQVMA